MAKRIGMTLRLTPELWRALKIAAVNRGTPAHEIVIEALDRHLSGEPRRTHASPRDWLYVSEAARQANVTGETIRNWCRKYNLGRTIGSRYRVDRDLFASFMSGTP